MTKTHVVFKKGSIVHIGEPKNNSIEISSIEELVEAWNEKSFKKGEVSHVLAPPVGQDFVAIQSNLDYFKDLLEEYVEKTEAQVVDSE